MDFTYIYQIVISIFTILAIGFTIILDIFYIPTIVGFFFELMNFLVELFVNICQTISTSVDVGAQPPVDPNKDNEEFVSDLKKTLEITAIAVGIIIIIILIMPKGGNGGGGRPLRLSDIIDDS